MFSSTSKSIKYYCETYAPLSKIIEVDVTDTENIITTFELCKDQINIFYMESCSNPNGKIFDFHVIPQLKQLSNIMYTIVDNTWLTEVIFNPFDYYSDFVVISCTKYYSGGNAILGAILANKSSDPIITNIQNYRRLSGCHVSPVNCDIVLKHISNMVSRINKGSRLTKGILEHLINVGHPKLVKIIHPFMKDHISNNMLKYFKNDLIPSVFLIGVELMPSKIIKKIKDCKIFDCKTSFGSKSSRFDCYCFRKDNITFVRVAIGYQDTMTTIIEGINELLDKI